MRSGLRVGPAPAEADAAVVVPAMIETPAGLANIEEICAIPGLDGVYVGPSDVCLAVADVFEAALTTVRDTAAAAGIHIPAGERAARRLAEG